MFGGRTLPHLTQPERRLLVRSPTGEEEDYWAGEEADLEPDAESPATPPGVPRRIAAALGQRCGLCGHTRLWHHVRLIPWGRE